MCPPCEEKESKCPNIGFEVVHMSLLNPISSGVLENQDMLGGGQFAPPSKSHV